MTRLVFVKREDKNFKRPDSTHNSDHTIITPHIILARLPDSKYNADQGTNSTYSHTHTQIHTHTHTHGVG